MQQEKRKETDARRIPDSVNSFVKKNKPIHYSKTRR